MFDLFWVMTNQELQSLSTFVFESLRVSQLQFPQGNAAAVFIFVSAFLIALFFIRVLGMQTSQEE
jgi:multiple sugar transport system permease protein